MLEKKEKEVKDCLEEEAKKSEEIEEAVEV